MLWTKCGKLLRNTSSQVIDCRDCPCGYYALFAFVVRNYDQNTGEVAECAYMSVTVQACEVIDSKINFSMYASPRCIEVNRLPGVDGKVGYVKSCVDCWEDCCEWNDDYTQCVKTCLQCMDCSEIDVYRMSPCCETEQELAHFLYPPCNVEPGSDGKYPAVFTYSYGQKVMTNTAQNCCWNYWQPLADSRYIPRISLDYVIFERHVVCFANSQQWREVIDGYYYDCEGTCNEWGDSGCTDCDGNLIEYPMTHQEYVQDCHIVSNLWDGGADDDVYIGISVCDYSNNQNYPECYCTNLYNESSAAGLGAINSAMNAKLADKSKFDAYSYSKQSSENPCIEFEYKSEWKPGECWAANPITSIFRKWARYAKVTINRHSKTPEGAKAVECQVWCYHYKGRDNNCNYDSYTQSHGTDTIYGGDIVTFSFGEEKELPMANNMADLYLFYGGHCNSNLDSDTVYFGPHYYWYCHEDPDYHGCQEPARVRFKIKVLRYIY